MFFKKKCQLLFGEYEGCQNFFSCLYASNSFIMAISASKDGSDAYAQKPNTPFKYVLLTKAYEELINIVTIGITHIGDEISIFCFRDRA